MEVSKQEGFGLMAVLVAVGVVVAGVAVYTSQSSQTSPVVVSDDFVADPAKSGIENMAQNIAENATDEMMDDIDKGDAMVESDMSDDMEKEADMMDTDMTDEVEVSPTTPPVAGTAGTFEAYSADKLALAETGDVVLFFHADWCPSCRGLENDLTANLSSIPANTHILKLDYDTETELKQKYGVVRQHTLIQVDTQGNEIKKLTGLTNTVDQVVNQL